jgi:hypothetical protein
MPMPAVLGTIAQQGQAGSGGGGGGGGSAPSNVSVATSSSGNFDDAVIVDCTSGSGVIVANAGSTFSSGTGDIELVYGPAYSSALNLNSGVLTFETYGYCRATSATSFSWGLGNVQEVQDTNNAVSSVAKSGSGSTAQDRTSNDIGIEVKITHNSGGRGYALLSASGDGFSWDVNCDATNSNGTTTSSPTVTPRILIP